MTQERPKISSDGSDDNWWFNLKTLEVEHGYFSPSKYRVGPFATSDEAGNALKLLADKSRAWSKDDEEERN
ncbi:MAG: SPOR domain-containing protein [Microbacteriaceae bacterium]